MHKQFIPNRHGQKISVLVEQNPLQKGLAFVMHGLGGYKEQPHIAAFAKAFYDKGFTVIRFDTTHTFGESEGKYEDATTTNYYEDLADVIDWSKTQPWWQQPFWLCGHSLGGICTALYAQHHPDQVFAIAPISPVISGKLSTETYTAEELANWQKTGWKELTSQSGRVKRLKYTEYLDRQKYDLLKKVASLTMPILIIVGENDDRTPVKHQKIFYAAIPSTKKELHVIKTAPHTFYERTELDQITAIFDKWIDKWL